MTDSRLINVYEFYIKIERRFITINFQSIFVGGKSSSLLKTPQKLGKNYKKQFVKITIHDVY